MLEKKLSEDVVIVNGRQIGKCVCWNGGKSESKREARKPFFSSFSVHLKKKNELWEEDDFSLEEVGNDFFLAQNCIYAPYIF